MIPIINPISRDVLSFRRDLKRDSARHFSRVFTQIGAGSNSNDGNLAALAGLNMMMTMEDLNVLAEAQEDTSAKIASAAYVFPEVTDHTAPDDDQAQFDFIPLETVAGVLLNEET